MNVSDNLAIIAGKLSAHAIKKLGAGLGSNLPGKLARRLSSTVLAHLSAQARSGVIAVSGTNGKSTTSGFLYAILRRAGLKTVHNRQGANLVTGITASVIQASGINGRLDADYCLFEVDEATLPVVASEVALSAVVVTNLFRDQLDRFGELDTTAQLLDRGITAHYSRAVLNADDPNVAQLAQDCQRIYYGIQSLDPRSKQLPSASAMELSYCSKCGAEYSYDLIFYGQLGHYTCPNCHYRRPQPAILAENVHVQQASSSFNLKIFDQSFEAHIALPGLFNVYNALAASAMAASLGIAGVTIVDGLKKYTTLFGRSERMTLGGKSVLIQLIKNPAGTSQVLASFSAGEGRLLIAINDNLADGRDISWLWDAEFELIRNHQKPIVVSGRRAQDMAVRLKYAGIAPDKIIVQEQLSKALDETLDKAEEGETVWVLPTYTCLLELQKIMKKKGQALSGT